MLTRFRPSPALIVASLALVVAIGGTAYATTTISGSTITDHSIAGRKLIDNTLAGRQINESGLETVPRATQASNANTVGGITVRKIFYAPTTVSSTPVTILSLGGLTLKASCAGDFAGTLGTVAIEVTSAVNHTHLSSQMWNSGGGGQSDGLHLTDFGPASTRTSDDLTDQNPWGETSFTYVRPNQTTVSGELTFDSSNLISPNGNIFNNTAKCLVSGFAMSTTST
jgi:hypothetical protein